MESLLVPRRCLKHHHMPTVGNYHNGPTHASDTSRDTTWQGPPTSPLGTPTSLWQPPLVGPFCLEYLP